MCVVYLDANFVCVQIHYFSYSLKPTVVFLLFSIDSSRALKLKSMSFGRGFHVTVALLLISGPLGEEKVEGRRGEKGY